MNTTNVDFVPHGETHPEAGSLLWGSFQFLVVRNFELAKQLEVSSRLAIDWGVCYSRSGKAFVPKIEHLCAGLGNLAENLSEDRLVIVISPEVYCLWHKISSQVAGKFNQGKPGID